MSTSLVHRARERAEQLLGQTLFRAPHALQARAARALVPELANVVDGLTLEPELQLLLALRTRLGSEGIATLTPERARLRMRRDTALHAGPHVAVGGVEPLPIPTAGAALAARHYAPPAAHGAWTDVAGRAPALLVYLHGGGFVVGDLDTADLPCRLLCAHAGVHVLSVAYRLAPEEPFPAAVDDACAAFRWARTHASALGADPTRVAIGGDSAGAQLATVVAQECARRGEPQPRAQLLLYPPTSRTEPWPSLTHFARGYLLERADVDTFEHHYVGHLPPGDQDTRHRPLDGLASVPAGAPLAPALVVTAGFDPLRDEGEAYADALTARGVRTTRLCYRGLVHGFANLAGTSPVCRAATLEVAHALAAELRIEARERP